MWFLKRKKVADKIKEDRELVETNSKFIEALVVLAKDNDAIVNELNCLKEKLKYLIPSDKPKVITYDKMIKNKLDDMRIVITKLDSEVTKKVKDMLTEVNFIIASRNTNF